MPKHRIILPILNNVVEIFGEPAFYFDDEAFIDTIYVEDFGAFFSGIDSAYKDGVTPTTPCIYIDDVEEKDFLVRAKEIGIKVRFALNFFAKDAPVLLPYACLLSKGDSRKSSTIQDVADVEAIAGIHKLRQSNYAVSTDRERFADFMKIVNAACLRHPPALFTIGRFSSCFTRFDEVDRIVDACVSLESLIQGQQELSFRFGLYLALICESDPTKRGDAFARFRNLYSARSSIVHGDLREKDIEKVRKDWKITQQQAFAAINYYLAFLFENDAAGWDEHLRGLALGSDIRIL